MDAEQIGCADSAQTAAAAKPSAWKGAVMVLVFSTVSIMNGFCFVATASVSGLAKQHYAVGDTEINLIGQSVFLGYLIGLPAYAILYNRRGARCLRIALIAASSFILVGVCLRMVKNIYLVIVGTLLTGVAIPFFLGMPTALAASWFSSSQSSLVVAVSAMSNQLGIALGFLMPPLLISAAHLDEGFNQLNIGTAIAATISFLLVCFIFKDNPCATITDHIDLPQQLTMSRDPAFLLICGTFGVVVSVYWNVAILLSESLDSDFSTNQIGTFGTVLMASGAVGMVLSGFVLECSTSYKWIISTLLVLSCTAFSAFCVLVQNELANELGMLLLCAICGFLMPSVQAPLLELAVVQCPNIDEFVGGSLVFMWTMLISIVLTVATTVLSVHALYYIFVGLFVGVTILFVFLSKNVDSVNLAVADEQRGPRRRSFNESYTGSCNSSFSGSFDEDLLPRPRQE